jgi:hypothetical protein
MRHTLLHRYGDEDRDETCCCLAGLVLLSSLMLACVLIAGYLILT